MLGTSSKGITPHKMLPRSLFFIFMQKCIFSFIILYHGSIIETFDKIWLFMLMKYLVRDFFYWLFYVDTNVIKIVIRTASRLKKKTKIF